MVTLCPWQLSRNILTNVCTPVRATKPIVENLVCELWRVVDGKKNKKVDCFYGYDFFEN